MKYQKKVIATDMAKCYAIGMFDGFDGPSFVIATEKEGPIRRFSLDGTALENICEGPGGVMTVMQTPGRSDQLLSTYKFFSPNFGADDAKIVSYTHMDDGSWARSVICDLPYVHRFGVLKAADGQEWLIACTIKSACRAFKNDWKTPGAVYVAKLDDKLEQYNETKQLPLTQIANLQLQNHGFYVAPDRSFALIGTAAGVFRYVPPAKDGDTWQIACLAVQPTSDMCLIDLDGDGLDELVTISAFHGDTLCVWHAKEQPDTFQKVWEDSQKHDFLHAIWSGFLAGQACAVLGNRKDDRDLLRLYYKDGAYGVEVIDHDCGPANVWVFQNDGNDVIISANRETNEAALYQVSAE
ncbi:MAG: hypothetical protein SPD80_01710 [Atopobium sp.]|uniref:hypothetical protein n=1 Tax=Atopobium sp. TaxID=1872650 RepID=UPI002A81EF69|nr:hypothetical protein [Atopobium sp.]MDY4522294.1 hypothetical protein [Atopobium sp.]